ncbi:doublecortin domain-containing protein 2B [Gastrophryne carolinensis]
MSSTSAVQLLPHGKNVMLYKNGDPFYSGRRMVVNEKQFITFDAFLNEVTARIQAPTAVRNIYTPRNGHRVTQLTDLLNRGQYVAGGAEKFRKLDYLHTEVKPHVAAKVKDIQQISRKHIVAGRWREDSHLPCIIHVFRNGDLLTPPIRVLIPPSILKEWELVLTLLTEKANLYSGAVRRICTLDGVSISCGAELVSGEYYVVVGSEKFKCLPYEELLTPLGRNKSRAGVKRRVPKVAIGKVYSVSQDGVSDSALSSSEIQGDQRRVYSTGAVPNSSSVPHPSKEEDSVFYAKPVRARPARKNKPNQSETKEEGGVFKVKEVRQELQGAQEIKEDSQTHVEVPVDQREAEIVQEENVHKKGRRPELTLRQGLWQLEKNDERKIGKSIDVADLKGRTSITPEKRVDIQPDTELQCILMDFSEEKETVQKLKESEGQATIQLMHDATKITDIVHALENDSAVSWFVSIDSEDYLVPTLLQFSVPGELELEALCGI